LWFSRSAFVLALASEIMSCKRHLRGELLIFRPWRYAGRARLRSFDLRWIRPYDIKTTMHPNRYPISYRRHRYSRFLPTPSLLSNAYIRSMLRCMVRLLHAQLHYRRHIDYLISVFIVIIRMFTMILWTKYSNTYWHNS
jgi:hypothetical protein